MNCLDKSPECLAVRAIAGFPPVAENGIKAALTTGMTTDRKIFQSRKFCAIMVQNQISGYSAVGSALDLGVPWRYPRRGKAKRRKAL